MEAARLFCEWFTSVRIRSTRKNADLFYPPVLKLQDLLLGPLTLLNDAQGGVIYSFENGEFKPWLVAPTFKGQALMRGNRPLPDVLCQVNAQSLWGVGYETKATPLVGSCSGLTTRSKTGLAYLAATFPSKRISTAVAAALGGAYLR